MKRAEADMEWWPDTTPHVGMASGAGAAPDTSDYSGTLWVPDPEARRGWREVYVDKPKPGSRPVGFRR